MGYEEMGREEMAKIVQWRQREQGACHPMSSHFQSYVANFNRMRLNELIDHHATRARYAQARASLIANPLTGRPYSAGREEQSDTFTTHAVAR